MIKEVRMMATHAKAYKELSCRDFRADCDFVARAGTAEEVMKKCEDHACSVHGKCGSSPQIREKMKSRMKDVQI
jgi:predicted small metal-binding protein